MAAKTHILTPNDLQVTDDDVLSISIVLTIDYRISATTASISSYFVHIARLMNYTPMLSQHVKELINLYPRQESDLRPHQLSSYKAGTLPLSYEGLFSLIQLIFQFIEVGY